MTRVLEMVEFFKSFNGDKTRDFPSDTVLGILIGVPGGEIRLIEMGDYQFRLEGDDLTLGADGNPEEYLIPYVTLAQF